MQSIKVSPLKRARKFFLAGAIKGGALAGAFMTFVLLSNTFLPTTHASPWVRVIVVTVAVFVGTIVGAVLGAVARQLHERDAPPPGRRIFALLAGVCVFSYLGWVLEFFSTMNQPGILAALACGAATGLLLQRELAR